MLRRRHLEHRHLRRRRLRAQAFKAQASQGAVPGAGNHFGASQGAGSISRSAFKAQTSGAGNSEREQFSQGRVLKERAVQGAGISRASIQEQHPGARTRRKRSRRKHFKAQAFRHGISRRKRFRARGVLRAQAFSSTTRRTSLGFQGAGISRHRHL
jgi:hypothetical protein